MGIVRQRHRSGQDGGAFRKGVQQGESGNFVFMDGSWVGAVGRAMLVVSAASLMMVGVVCAQETPPPRTPALPPTYAAPEPTPPPQPVKPALQLEEPEGKQPAPSTDTTPAAQSPAQEPGNGAQVRTGSTISGLDDLLGKLSSLLGDHQILEVEKLVDDSDAETDGKKGAKLSPQQSQLYRGVIANRENKPQESIQLLEPLVAQMQDAAIAPEEKLLRRTLAEDYLRAGDWKKAAQAYQDYATRLGATLTPDEQDEIELPLKLLPLVTAYPPMTVESGDAFSLPYDRDVLGLTDVPVFVDAQSHDWMLDPTAPFNLICRSTAKEVGLKLSEQTATVHTITGRPMTVHATLIPRFTIGTITYRNMTAFVFDDADYAFPRSGYQVRGVLGYPAVSALGSLTVTSNSKIEVQPGDKGEHLTEGARFFLDGDRVLVGLGKPGDERMFVLDAAGQQTYLSSRYYSEHAGEFENQKMQLLSVPGAQNKPPAPTYVADTVKLLVGLTPVSFHNVQVLAAPQGSAAVDDTYGTLGMDALDELKSYTFDYRTMRFAATSH
jgi:predicted aspartyl protease